MQRMGTWVIGVTGTEAWDMASSKGLRLVARPGGGWAIELFYPVEPDRPALLIEQASTEDEAKANWWSVLEELSQPSVQMDRLTDHVVAGLQYLMGLKGDGQ